MHPTRLRLLPSQRLDQPPSVGLCVFKESKPIISKEKLLQKETNVAHQSLSK